MEDRIATQLWLDAQTRRLSQQGGSFYVVQRGADYAGTVLIDVEDSARGHSLYTQMRNAEGVLGWMRVFPEQPVDSEKAAGYIDRARARDPDLWVIAVDSRDGAMPFEGILFDAD